MQKIKANYMISKNSKDKLDKVKRKLNKTNSSIVDELLQFDTNSVFLFLKIFKEINQGIAQKSNYLQVTEGGLILNDSTMTEITHLISPINDDEISQNVTYNEKSLEEKMIILENAIVVIHKDQQKLHEEIDFLKYGKK